MYVAAAPDSWKARHVSATGRVAVTVCVRRGGILSLVAPIPPATISLRPRASAKATAAAIVHSAGTPETRSLLSQLGALLPPDRRETASVIQIVPEGEFVTFGIGVPLMKMRDPAAARGRAPAA